MEFSSPDIELGKTKLFIRDPRTVNFEMFPFIVYSNQKCLFCEVFIEFPLIRKKNISRILFGFAFWFTLFFKNFFFFNLIILQVFSLEEKRRTRIISLVILLQKTARGFVARHKVKYPYAFDYILYILNYFLKLFLNFFFFCQILRC